MTDGDTSVTVTSLAWWRCQDVVLSYNVKAVYRRRAVEGFELEKGGRGVDVCGEARLALR